MMSTMMKLALLATLASAAAAFTAPSTPLAQPQTARLPTRIFAEEEDASTADGDTGGDTGGAVAG